MIIASCWQTATYAVRAISIYQPTNDNVYAIWFVMILTGPLWINAFVYMVVGRMVYNFLPNHKLGGIKAWRFGMLFVILDIVAFLVQLFGASTASGTNIKRSQIMMGLHIYMGGVGFQELFIIMFSGLLVRFHLRLRREMPVNEQAQPLRLLYVVYAALVLITIRIIFRLIEYSNGITSTIPNHEAYMYILETTPMLIAVLLFNIVHPGAIMPGKESDIPGRKARKQMFPKKGKTGYKEVNAETEAELGFVRVPYGEETQYLAPNEYMGHDISRPQSTH